MKRKNVNVVPSNVSDEETSEDKQQLKDDDLEVNADESVINNDDEADGSEDGALDASATDSDESGSDVDSNINEDQEQGVPQKSKNEKVKEKILQRYQERHGKQLYIRLPHKVPETQEALEEMIKELTPLVVRVHKPRQRHVRYCIADFATNEDRDTALNDLKIYKKQGLVAKIPRTESSDFVSEIAERKIKSLENKKAKQRLRRASKKSLTENNFTSTVIVLNLPKTTSLLQVRELFTNAVDINIKPCNGKLNKDKCVAAITLPTTMDARNAIKKKLSLGGNQLFIKFDNQKRKKKRKSNKKKYAKVVGNTEEKINEESELKKPKLESPNDETVTEKEAGKQISTNKSKKSKQNTDKNKLNVVTK